MKVTQIRIERQPTTPLGVSNAEQTWSTRESLVVFADSEGGTGRGEACPLPGYSGNTIEDAERSLAPLVGAKELSFSSPEEVFEWVAARVGAECPCARFAIETALLEALALDRGCPVWALFGAPGVARVALTHCAQLPRPDPTSAARRALRRGAVAFKMKAGFPGQLAEEIRLVRELRSTFPSVPLRVDPNRGYGRAEYAAFLSGIADAEVEFMEEPLRRADLPWTGGGPPIAIDESLQLRFWDEELRRWALDERGCQFFVLKPTTLGGWSRCLELWKQGQEAGIRSIVSHCFGGGVEYAACHHLAAVCQAEHSLSAGLALHPGLFGSRYRFEPADLHDACGLGAMQSARG